jgi:tRNA U34 2-thiouridine synthase MnmA/TrmU
LADLFKIKAAKAALFLKLMADKKRGENIKNKALVLFSGGLDSMLAVKLLQEQGIAVQGIAFSSYFFSTKQAQKSARQLGIKLIEKDISQKHLSCVKQPQFGYGKALNPCIDCHLLMLKEAFNILQKKGFNILATGEVLGQRPFSQNRFALEQIEKTASLKAKILRPLSAKVLAETEYEKKKQVNRAKLEGIKGRSRRCQIKLAKKFNIKEFPSPAGGAF